MFWWKVKYLTLCGVMSVYEKEEYYRAWTKKGAWKCFLRFHGDNLPTDYTDESHFLSYRRMRKDILKVDKKPEEYATKYGESMSKDRGWS